MEEGLNPGHIVLHEDPAPPQKRGTVKAINKEKLPELGYTTDHNSYWLANVVRLLDANLTPGQRIERDLSYGRCCD